MLNTAFIASVCLRGGTTSYRVGSQTWCPRFSTQCHPPRPILWRASSIPESEQSGSSAEDDRLSLELRKKVNELFGGRQNVKIEMETDSNVQFTVHNKDYGTGYQQTRYAWTLISSIAVISVVAGLAFAALFYSGAVHGSDQERRYEMPTYGKSSYVNPYELFEEDGQFKDANILPDC